MLENTKPRKFEKPVTAPPYCLKVLSTKVIKRNLHKWEKPHQYKLAQGDTGKLKGRNGMVNSFANSWT